MQRGGSSEIWAARWHARQPVRSLHDTVATVSSGRAGVVVTPGMTPVGVSIVVLQRNAVLLAAFVRAR
ncbi:MAG: hypothetical protein JNM69_35095 [Archangium sp.]|nr:hypothetical protein [Archangium sp.]